MNPWLSFALGIVVGQVVALAVGLFAMGLRSSRVS